MKTLIARHKAGEHIGICSVCSAHPLVIEAALAFDLNSTRKVLIEATSNQVNQLGGYTGMTPADFREFVFAIADRVGFARERIILGGDHLGPNCWQQENADAAMEKSVELVKAYVRAGFSKIHLDASMSCAGDPVPLVPETVAERAAVLCDDDPVRREVPGPSRALSEGKRGQHDRRMGGRQGSEAASRRRSRCRV